MKSWSMMLKDGRLLGLKESRCVLLFVVRRFAVGAGMGRNTKHLFMMPQMEDPTEEKLIPANAA